ncbi:MAG: CinA family protein [Rubrivivax sp.]|nr:CinA family protein [Rubrivivax sp.]
MSVKCDPLALDGLVAALGHALRQRQQRMATAESCTGGLIAAACTAVAGSSDWFERGFVTYSNEAKVSMLGVDPQTLATHGAVSEAVAAAMVRGALAHAPVQWAVAVTGIAGPGGAVPGKPVGTVWIAWGDATRVQAQRVWLAGDRRAVREQTVRLALQALAAELGVADAPFPAAAGDPG